MADMRFTKAWGTYARGDIVHTNEVMSRGQSIQLVRDGILVRADAKLPPEPRRRGRPPKVKPEAVTVPEPKKETEPTSESKSARKWVSSKETKT